jgi:hypothetical protein
MNVRGLAGGKNPATGLSVPIGEFEAAGALAAPAFHLVFTQRFAEESAAGRANDPSAEPMQC